jgi:hypothetical protein
LTGIKVPFLIKPIARWRDRTLLGLRYLWKI